ncbi:ral guanine nucleotide dissociation stimulator-like [Dasypus novemcinctus]|uniref:ral guanine nucleotide dissociation stimulator-like n=1 Tax=Dasypus novemcinctus TaxID=9361 RepID=UPI0039C96F7A
MDQYWEDFLQPLDSPCLQLLAARAQEHLPGSGLQCRTALLLAQMRHTEPTEAEPEGEGASGWGHLQSHRGLQCDRQRQFQALRPTQVQSQSRLHHHPDCQLTIRPGQLEHLLRSHGQLQHHQEQELQSRGQVYLHLPRRRSTDRHCPLSRESLLLQQQKRRLASWKRPRGHLHCHLWRERQCPLRRQSRPHLQGQPHPHHQLPCCPWPGPCGDGLREQKPELLAFPPKLVAEQLSLMDAELFKKVVPYHCLGSIWSQRHQKGKEHVAPTVRAVISQFNRVADCVKATCLGDHSMKVADRARVVEHWIEVTRECQTLRNFSSGHAILSALERHVIGHQKKTWAEVSRDSFRLFQTLSEIFSSESDSSQGSELISQEDQLVAELQKLQGPDAESSGSGSTARSSVQLQGGPDVSSGDAADSPHLPVAGSSSSAVEIHLNHVPEAQDCQEAKPGQPTCASSPIGSTVPSASGGTSSSSSIQARATRTSRKPQDSWPRHKRHVGDRCFVRVTLAEDSGHKVQSILVTDQDRAPAVIRKALEEHELAGEQPEDYQLVQIISGDGTLQIPDGANVYYAMAPSPDYRFLLLRKTTPLDAEVKERALSALRGSRQKGPRFQKGKL